MLNDHSNPGDDPCKEILDDSTPNKGEFILMGHLYDVDQTKTIYIGCLWICRLIARVMHLVSLHANTIIFENKDMDWEAMKASISRQLEDPTNG